MTWDPQIAERFRSELSPGESVVWTGKPSRSVIFHAGDAYLIPFSLLWGGFAIFWEASVLGGFSHDKSAPWFFILWGIPFVIVGQYMIWGRFFFTYWKKNRTFYALTNRRALILHTALNRSLQSVDLVTVPQINKTVRRDGIGSIEFGSVSRQAGKNNLDTWDPTKTNPPSFIDVADADAVYSIAVQAQSGRQESARFG